MSEFDELVARLLDRGAPYYRRVDAAKALLRLGDERATDRLIAALKDDEKHVRREVVSALGELGEGQAVEPLAAVLDGDEDHEVRRNAVRALSQFADKRAFEAVRKATADTSSVVRQAAEDAVKKTQGALAEAEREAPRAEGHPRSDGPEEAALKPAQDETESSAEPGGKAEKLDPDRLGDLQESVAALKGELAAVRDELEALRGHAEGKLSPTGETPRREESAITQLRETSTQVLRAAAVAGVVVAVGALLVIFWASSPNGVERPVRVGSGHLNLDGDSGFELTRDVDTALKTAERAVEWTPPARITTYVVQPGDNPWGIAEKLLGDGRKYTQIAKWNPRLELNRLVPGETLVYWAPETQPVRTEGGEKVSAVLEVDTGEETHATRPTIPRPRVTVQPVAVPREVGEDEKGTAE